MEKSLKKFLKTLKINENLISTIMGGVVVLVMAVMIFNYFKSINKGGLITEEPAVKLTEEKNEGVVPDGLPATYKVAKGEDLWHIAEKVYGSGYNYVDIAKENKLANPNLIETGTELKMPRVITRKLTLKIPAKTGAAIESGSYTVVKGDYLWQIAVRAYGDGFAWIRIYEANKAKIGLDPNLIEKGIILTIPR